MISKKQINKSFILMMLISTTVFATLPVFGQDESKPKNIEDTQKVITITSDVIQDMSSVQETKVTIVDPIQPVKDRTIYTVTDVNIRTEPYVEAEVLATLETCTAIEWKGEEDGWTEVSSEAGEGYIKSEYITASKEEAQEALANKPTLVYMGNFRITYYCGCSKCCGKWAKNNKTKSGTTPEAGRTIAVSSKQIPLGTRVVIDGHEYIAEDTGSGIKTNCIDIYCASHSEALQLGLNYKDVYIVK